MKSSNPIISVLMPVYNGEKFLRQAIDSVLNQTYTDFEFLIINDGSTDISEEIILSYNDERIRYYKNEKNIQLIDTLNKGLKLANGQFIARMDADDICLPERFEKQVEVMQRRKDIAVCGSWYEKFGMGEPLLIRCWEEPYMLKCKTLFGSPVGHPASMIRRSALASSSLIYDSNYPQVEDWKLWSEMVKLGYSFYNLQSTLLLYRRSKTSVSTLNKEEQDIGSLKILTENMAHFFPSIKVSEHLEEIKNILKPLSIKNDLSTFKDMDIFFNHLDTKNTGQLDKMLLRNKLIDMWEYRLTEMDINIISKIGIIATSTFLRKQQHSFVTRIRLVFFHLFLIQNAK